MEITLNDKTYTAPTPVTGLWFAVQKMKTEQEKRVREITTIWNEIKPLEGQDNLDATTIENLEKTMSDLTLKTEANKRILLDSKIKIIVDTFKHPAITQESILAYLPLQDVSLTFANIESWLNDIVMGRTAQLPNE